MSNSPYTPAGAALLLAVAISIAPALAAAGERHWARQVQGPHGRGFNGSASFVRHPGSANFQAQRAYNNGSVAQWSGSTVRGEGVLSRSRSHTGARGRSQSAWSNVSRIEDGVARSHGASTSSGRGYTAQGQAQRTDSGLVISRSIATNSGRSASYTRTYPARRAD